MKIARNKKNNKVGTSKRRYLDVPIQTEEAKVKTKSLTRSCKRKTSKKEAHTRRGVQKR